MVNFAKGKKVTTMVNFAKGKKAAYNSIGMYLAASKGKSV